MLLKLIVYKIIKYQIKIYIYINQIYKKIKKNHYYNIN